MVSLLDIADVKMSASLRGKEVEVRGILAEHLALLFHRFPELKRVWVGKTEADTWTTLVNQFPMVVAEIIAIGTGAEPSDKDYQKYVDVAAKLTLGEQIHVLEKIGEITFPLGLKSALDVVGRALGVPIDELGWGQAMKSQLQSRGVLQQDETSEPVGDQRPASSQAG